jgi:hypothetical protein
MIADFGNISAKKKRIKIINQTIALHIASTSNQTIINQQSQIKIQNRTASSLHSQPKFTIHKSKFIIHKS